MSEYGDFDIKTASTYTLIASYRHTRMFADLERNQVIKQALELRCADLEAEIAMRNARILAGAS